MALYLTLYLKIYCWKRRGRILFSMRPKWRTLMRYVCVQIHLFEISWLYPYLTALIKLLLCYPTQENRHLDALNKELKHKLSEATSENVLLKKRCEKFGVDFAQYETKLEKFSEVCVFSQSALWSGCLLLSLLILFLYYYRRAEI